MKGHPVRCQRPKEEIGTAGKSGCQEKTKEAWISLTILTERRVEMAFYGVMSS